MVFSQTSQKTHSILKLVELNHLKSNKNQQENDGLNGVVTEVPTLQQLSSPVATTSFSEEYLKPEPLYETKMFHDSDSEFFQDLVQWCSNPAKVEQVQTIDLKAVPDETHKTDTLHTNFSPQGWDSFDVNSPAITGLNSSRPNDPLSPSGEELIQLDKFNYSDLDNEKNMFFQEQFLDISSLPVVIGDLASEVDMNSGLAPDPVNWELTHNTDYNTLHHNTPPLPFIDQEDSLDAKFMSVTPQDIERSDLTVSEYNMVTNVGENISLLEKSQIPSGLTLNVSVPAWPPEIDTPEVLNCVQQLEETCPQANMKSTTIWPGEDAVFAKDSVDFSIKEYEPITPKSESLIESDQVDSPPSTRRKRSNSEDSDETYTPYAERTSPRKYKRRKPNVPIKEMILALEGSQQLTKARRGRPPKRRESTVSSVCSMDDNASTHENKYRELRDKNNEASKRSRMNRKLKELQMEQLALDLEQRNKKLKVKADILEDMTKRLKDALMTAILQK